MNATSRVHTKLDDKSVEVLHALPLVQELCAQSALERPQLGRTLRVGRQKGEKMGKDTHLRGRKGGEEAAEGRRGRRAEQGSEGMHLLLAPVRCHVDVSMQRGIPESSSAGCCTWRSKHTGKGRLQSLIHGRRRYLFFILAKNKIRGNKNSNCFAYRPRTEECEEECWAWRLFFGLRDRLFCGARCRFLSSAALLD